MSNNKFKTLNHPTDNHNLQNTTMDLHQENNKVRVHKNKVTRKTRTHHLVENNKLAVKD